MRLSRLACATTICTIAALVVTPASHAAENSECSYKQKGNSVHAHCTNNSDHMATANLYVDCQPNWHNPHVRKAVGPHQSVDLSTKCGGWSHVVGATAYLN